MAVDHVLKWYARTIQSPYLHYGYWDDPETIDPKTFSLKDILQAQEQYITHLAEQIPDDVRSILDVGCGIGGNGNAAFLLDRGYSVEVLSPDKYQEAVIGEKFGDTLRFHRTKFENFTPDHRFDLILESESAAYIKIQPGFEAAHRCLRPGGYMLVSDYFVINEDESGSPHLKGAHRLTPYLEAARTAGFSMVKDVDITPHILPTLNGAHAFVNRFVWPTTEYVLYSIKRKHPKLLASLRLMFNGIWKRKQKQLALIDSQEFQKYRRYKVFLFQKETT
ncbi:MAG: class I SAM-dependent methyltransferase [FCB group bacterium]|nr:class I SAM-dependent methyltransferase [FCB group bacterium]